MSKFSFFTISFEQVLGIAVGLTVLDSIVYAKRKMTTNFDSHFLLLLINFNKVKFSYFISFSISLLLPQIL